MTHRLATVQRDRRQTQHCSISALKSRDVTYERLTGFTRRTTLIGDDVDILTNHANYQSNADVAIITNIDVYRPT